jgi:enoyl-CoA hydratase/carnithine racemase
VKEGPIAILTISRPEAMNALGEARDGTAFEAACKGINADRIHCGILTVEGRAFSAGGNVMKDAGARHGAFAGSPAEIREAYRTNIHGILRALYFLEVPLVAAVNLPAIGLRCDVACMADIRVASSTARFGGKFHR